jgi:hypothetical protein
MGKFCFKYLNCRDCLIWGCNWIYGKGQGQSGSCRPHKGDSKFNEFTLCGRGCPDEPPPTPCPEPLPQPAAVCGDSVWTPFATVFFCLFWLVLLLLLYLQRRSISSWWGRMKFWWSRKQVLPVPSREAMVPLLNMEEMVHYNPHNIHQHHHEE